MSPSTRYRMSIAVAAVIVVAAVAWVALRRGGGTGGDAARRSPVTTVPRATGATAAPGTTPTTAGEAAAPAGLKPAIKGLIDRDGMPPPALRGLVRSFVAHVDWAQLQPQPNGPIAEGNPIDDALRAVRAANASNPSQPMTLKLRVLAGIGAPPWAKQLGGAPVAVNDPASGAGGTIGRYWTPAFRAAYDDLQAKLAARYDAAPEVREVAMTRCTTVFGESFIRGAFEPANVAALLGAGYTVAADKQCIRDEITAARSWAHVRSDMAVAPYQVVAPRPTSDDAFTLEMMRLCRSTLGPRCVLESNSIRTPPQPQYVGLYDQMRNLGPPITFQTATGARLGDLAQTVAYAADLGAASVELPAAYRNIPPASLSAQLTAPAGRLSDGG